MAEGKINAAEDGKILQDNFGPSARELRLQRTFIFQEDNDPKHLAAVAQKWFEDNRGGWNSEWPSQSPDLIPMENLWLDLKRLRDVEQFGSKTALSVDCGQRWIYWMEDGFMQSLLLCNRFLTLTHRVIEIGLIFFSVNKKTTCFVDYDLFTKKR